MTKSSRKRARTSVVYRESKTGRFVSVRVAKRRPATVTVERISMTGRYEVSHKSARVIEQTDKKYSRALDRLAKR